MIKAKVSFHGHSKYSDGIDSVKTLVMEAAKLKIDYFGLSDHNTTDHIVPFYHEVDVINAQYEQKIIPICAVEIALHHKGDRIDLLFARPGDLDLDFLAWIDALIKDRANTLDIFPIIEKAISIFNVLVVIPHPQMPHTPSISISFELLKELADTLSVKIKQNIGVEIRNWSSNILPKNSQREEKLSELVTQLSLAEFGLADYHGASDIKYMYTIAEVEEKTPNELIKAVQNRQVHPVRLTSASRSERFEIVKNLGRAIIRSKFLSKEMKDRMRN